MGEAILLALWVGTSVFFICREEKAKNDRESHAWWLSDVRASIDTIECEFRRLCKKIAEEEFSKPSFNEYRYSSRIRELEEAYKTDLTNRIIALHRVRVTTVPDHLVREYEINISNIAYTFRYFGNIMSEQITK